MDEEVGSLQPWQIYSALYLGFYVVSAYFDHFVISFVFCIAFGVISEIVTKYMNGEQISYTAAAAAKADDLDSLLCMAKKEATLVPSLTQMAKVEATRTPEEQIMDSNDEIWECADKQLDDDAPPPLPDKDYLMDQQTNMEEVASRLTQPRSVQDEEEEEEEEETEEEEEEEEEVVEEIVVRNSEQELNAEVLRHVSEGHCPVISEIQNQDSSNNSTENIRSMSEISGEAIHTDNKTKDEEEEEEELEEEEEEDDDDDDDNERRTGKKEEVTEEMIDKAINLFSTRVVDEDEDGSNDMFIENDVTEAEAKYVENNIRRAETSELASPGVEVETKDENKFYAPDSSSDEEIDEDSGPVEVDLGETESSDEDEYNYSKGIQQKSTIVEPEIREIPVRDGAGEGVLLDLDTQVEPLGHIKDIVDHGPVSPNSSPALVPEVGCAQILVPSATVPALAPVPDTPQEDFSDLDLKDPALELAATKIQSVFKGFQARKKSGKT